MCCYLFHLEENVVEVIFFIREVHIQISLEIFVTKLISLFILSVFLGVLLYGIVCQMNLCIFNVGCFKNLTASSNVTVFVPISLDAIH